MDNQEEIHDVLTLFEKKPSTDIPQVLEDYLKTVAKTGKTLFPWQRVKVLFITKVEQVMEQFNKDVPYDHLPPFPNVENTKYVEMQKRIADAMQRFTGAPFTVQRICELVTQPRKHYTRCDKFLRGIEKNVMVVSSVDPYGKKIVSESRIVVNGMDTNGFGQKGDMNDFTDGQPFSPLLQTNWSNNNTTTVWPGGAGILDSVDSLQKLSATVAAATESTEPNQHNTNSHHHLHSATENGTNIDKYGEDASTSPAVSSNLSASRFSALFQEKTIEDNINTNESSSSSSSSQDTGSFKEENSDVDSVSDSSSSESGSQKSDSDSNASTEEQQEKAEEVSTPLQKEEPPPDNTDEADSRGEDGPPEKKMRISETSPSAPSEEGEQESSEAEVANNTQEPQSSSQAEDAAPMPEVTEECGSIEQQVSPENSDVSQSDSTPSETTSPDNQSEAQAIAADSQSEATASVIKSDDTQASENVSESLRSSSPVNEQSNVSSTDDAPAPDSVETETQSEQTDSCADSASSKDCADTAPESSNTDSEAQSENKEIEVSAGSGEVVQDDSGEDKVTEEEKMSDSECTSATELMETNQAPEEKQDTEPQSSTETPQEHDETEPMEQD